MKYFPYSSINMLYGPDKSADIIIPQKLESERPLLADSCHSIQAPNARCIPNRLKFEFGILSNI